MKGLRARLDYILKHNKFIWCIFNWTMSYIMRIWGTFLPINKKMILFSALSRKYNDSPRVIYEKLISLPQFSDYIFVWALEDLSTNIPGSNVVKVKADSLSYFRLALKAKYWISSVNIERSLHFKKRKCIYLNTWHGTPLKHIGNDAVGRNDFNFSSIDYFCFASTYEKNIMLKAFKTRQDAMIPTGLPRNDILYLTQSEATLQHLKSKLHIPKNKKVILYAPTWRDSSDNGKTYSIAPPINTNYWKEQLSEEYVILFRTHGYTNKLIGIEFDDIIIDVSTYPDINDLFFISDILISDYSASIVDYSILERPIICFGYDYEDYKASRGLYIDLNTEMPSGVLKTEQEVIHHIISMDYTEECDKSRRLKNKYCCYGGSATEKCIELLFNN